MGGGRDVLDDREWEGFDAVRGGILLLEGLQHTFEPMVDVAQGGQTGVRGPHTAERLPHASEGILHGSRADGLFGGAANARTVPECEDLEDWDGVGEVREGGIQP